ncbi:BamA/TamA family outer membrane protein [Belliella kenyensis]|uniref:BamA/TamA family outer membrane protein n=1 Tax=Belliella kenyensis TaxID=1472724 RepID=A0ABV8EQK3_9BACT|nr:BamA/TamA family outer membrane protein [Belliella kenyensis]MCH7401592.1 BamA/TamA family outer membrane protein [Belliella kenyensis]MDN3603128.1 BamA/TamA family outer membrane protein [Belliella kenyensis]
MKYILVAIFIFLSLSTQAQEFSEQDSTAQPRSIVDPLFDIADGIVNLISGEKWSFIPAVVYSPETSLGLGARAIRIFKTHEDPLGKLRPSSLPITFLYTLNKQVIFTTELELWKNENRDFIHARIMLADYPFKFYGLGNDLNLDEAESYSTKYAYVHLNYERQLLSGLYFGPKYEFRVDDIYDVQPAGKLATGQIAGSNGQRISGLGFVMNHDTRNNIFQPTRGWYNRLSWMSFQRALGSNFTFDQYILDLRKYVKIYERHVLVVQSFWSFTSGNPPFQHVSLIGGSDLMRGYFEGRYRDRHAVVQQAEYRLPVHRNLGLVVFGSAGQVAEQINHLEWKRMKYGAGLGIRYKLSPEGLNLRIDIAYGDQRAFYFGLNEVL